MCLYPKCGMVSKVSILTAIAALILRLGLKERKTPPNYRPNGRRTLSFVSGLRHFQSRETGTEWSVHFFPVAYDTIALISA